MRNRRLPKLVGDVPYLGHVHVTPSFQHIRLTKRGMACVRFREPCAWPLLSLGIDPQYFEA
jgi:hypothetical protein